MRQFTFTFLLLFIISIQAVGQIDMEALKKASQGLTLREIGPASMGGRIADIAVNPINKSEWYVAVGSGGVWKTKNAGITWQPIFDQQSSYSIGTVSLDPLNPSVVWVGTGENVSGRHVGWGDGVYKSLDGGKSWKNMGLKGSDHIGKVLIDPRNSDVIFVAAEGPLWSSGGKRGLYKSIDGGKSWKQTLAIDENTGVTDIEFDPANPDVLYAATYERRRKTWSLLAGGPNSGIYKSTDKGETWRKLTSGLPSGEVGKIGLAVTAANPDLVYATIEAAGEGSGFYKSMDKGESWSKRNSYISGGTGPHYYQEIEASTTDPDLVYQMDVFLHVTRDGGDNFDYLVTGKEKHSDNHALWIDPDNGQHLIAGCDGGLYESFDQGKKWRHFSNLPIAQFYKIAVDNAEPFYHIVAGAQDLGTLIGPSRTTTTEGIENHHWYVPLGADGYDAAFDPDDPNTVYMEIQGGELYRLDRRTEEVISIKPRPEPNDPPERWNWDSPIIVSPHDSKTLYFGSQRVWKSMDRGNTWQVVSGDLTTNTNRYSLSMMENVPSVDALYDNGAMSKYATLTNLSESPVQKGLIYSGSDDGLIHRTEDGGDNWKLSGKLPNVPERSFINDVEASSHEADVIFASADAHKLGDYKPYLFMSSDKGKSWTSIVGDLPKETIVWSIKQDPVDKDLLFIGTEYGIYFSPNKGQNWIKLSGAPTIPFRDIELHGREHDLIGGSFGRGVWVLDDYSPLREMKGKLQANSVFPVKDAWWYIPSVPYQAKGMPSQGSATFKLPNPDFGAIITYYVHEVPKTTAEKRKESEKILADKGEDIPFPGWDVLSFESKEGSAQLLFLIRDDKGAAIRWLNGTTKKGLHRLSWDLRLPAPQAISLSKPAFQPPWAGDPQGPMVAPGTYSVEMFVLKNGKLESQGEAQNFRLNPIPSLQTDSDFDAIAAFQRQTMELYRKVNIESRRLSEVRNKLRFMRVALMKTTSAEPKLFEDLQKIEGQLRNMQIALQGDWIRGAKDESSVPSLMSRVWQSQSWGTTQEPTATHKKSYELALAAFEDYRKKTERFFAEVTVFEEALSKAGAPYTPGRRN
ncbi:MAG: glycosyl hydrolase [Bacteroidota bacterium]